MKVKLWGVRGSIPSPISNSQIQSKIAAIVQRIKSEDIKSQKSREEFIANLPSYLLNTVGANTTCIEIILDDNTPIIIDAGSGIRALGKELVKYRKDIREYNIFFSHFHWDHVQGLPFFDPAFFSSNTINFLSPIKGFRSFLESQMQEPFFPVPMSIMGSKRNFIEIDEQPIKIKNSHIFWRKMKHPGACYSYKVVENGKSIIFSTDTELSQKDFKRNDENRIFYEGVDVLIMDTQYTLDEAIEKSDWGHSSYSMAIDFAVEWNIKNLVLFHHEPVYDDKKLYNIYNSSKWYLDHIENENVNLKVILGIEGLEIEI